MGKDITDPRTSRSTSGEKRGGEPRGQKSGHQIGGPGVSHHSAGGANIKESQKKLSTTRKSTESARSKSPKMKKKAVPAPSKSNEKVGEFSSFAQECLQAHNHYRAKHGVQPLKLSKKLCQFAEEWVKRLASSGQMQHRPNSEYGENLFCVWSSDPNHKVAGNEPVDNWYAEIKDFTFGQEPRDLRSGHFTQVVWKDSANLGVAQTKSKNSQIFVVCNYEPPGNFIGNFAKQVLPVGGAAQSKEAEKAKEQKKAAPAPPAKKQGPSAPVSASDSQGDQVLQNESLSLHNELRAKHGAPPVNNDKEISKFCKEWADTLIRENKFGHRPNNTYGENIFCHWTNDLEAANAVGAKEAINAWYSEIKDFRFGEEPKVLKSGHFTQLIWKSTQRIGIARSRDGKGRVIIVANYDPRGNYIGQFVDNCPPPKN